MKKATSFQKLHEMMKEKKKGHLRQPIVSPFKSEDISCVEKHYLQQNKDSGKVTKKNTDMSLLQSWNAEQTLSLVQ